MERGSSSFGKRSRRDSAFAFPEREERSPWPTAPNSSSPFSASDSAWLPPGRLKQADLKEEALRSRDSWDGERSLPLTHATSLCRLGAYSL